MKIFKNIQKLKKIWWSQKKTKYFRADFVLLHLVFPRKEYKICHNSPFQPPTHHPKITKFRVFFQKHNLCTPRNHSFLETSSTFAYISINFCRHSVRNLIWRKISTNILVGNTTHCSSQLLKTTNFCEKWSKPDIFPSFCFFSGKLFTKTSTLVMVSDFQFFKRLKIDDSLWFTLSTILISQGWRFGTVYRMVWYNTVETKMFKLRIGLLPSLLYGTVVQCCMIVKLMHLTVVVMHHASCTIFCVDFCIVSWESKSSTVQYCTISQSSFLICKSRLTKTDDNNKI